MSECKDCLSLMDSIMASTKKNIELMSEIEAREDVLNNILMYILDNQLVSEEELLQLGIKITNIDEHPEHKDSKYIH